MKSSLRIIFILIAGMFILTNVVANGTQDEASQNVVQYQEPFYSDGFNPDFYEAAVSYNDVFDLLGPIPTPKTDLRLGYIAKAFENEYWRAVKEGAEDEEARLIFTGSTIVVDVKAAQGESDDQGQLAIMKVMLNSDYDAFLISPITDANLEPGIEKAFKKNIPMVNVVGGLASVVPAYVGPRHIESGELAAKWLADTIGNEGGQVACVTGIPTAGAARSRTQGFVEWFGKNAPEFEVVDTQNADWDRLKANDVVGIWLKTYPELKGIYCNNDTMAMGALEAVKTADKLGEVFVVGNDGTAEAYTSIKDGELSATVNIFPFYNSKMAIDIALRILGGQEVPRVVWTSQALIDNRNVDKSAEEILDWNGLQF